jgi:hypothetical protein
VAGGCASDYVNRQGQGKRDGRADRRGITQNTRPVRQNCPRMREAARTRASCCDRGAAFLAERSTAAVGMTTNLPFSEWTQVIPNSRLCKALLDRVTDPAHIIETGSESYRFRRTRSKSGRRKAEG